MSSWFDTYIDRTRQLSTVSMATIPLILIYGLFLPWAGQVALSGVDLISRHLLESLSLMSWMGIQLGVAVFLLVLAIERRNLPVREHFRWALLSILEALLWGLSLGAIVVFALQEAKLLSTGPYLFSHELINHMVLSAGAGLHEELLFRLLAIPLLTWLMGKLLGLSKNVAVLSSVILAALLFSLAHHLAGEAFGLYVFSYRSIAGLVFGYLFVQRGFAITAWTHAIYDFSILLS